MEYLSIKGCIGLLNGNEAGLLEKKLMDKLKNIRFLFNEGSINPVIRDGKIRVNGEGLIDEDEGRRLIRIVDEVSAFMGDRCEISIQKTRWELNITLGFRLETIPAARQQDVPEAKVASSL